MKRDNTVAYAVMAVLMLGAALWYSASRPKPVPDPGLDLSTETPAALGADAMLAFDAGLEVVGEDVAYFGDAKGYFVRPVAEGSYPGVITIHEWWGLNDGMKEAARTLASHGYLVLAVDLYQGKVAATPEEARAYVSSLDQADALKNMQAALAHLKGKGAGKLASLGWCFGGGQSLQLALREDLDATVIYYGQLETDPTKLKAVRQPVLGVFGDADTAIPVEGVREFEAALNGLDIENEIYVYPGVGHAFANPSGANYAPEETMDAWNKTLDFLARHLR